MENNNLEFKLMLEAADTDIKIDNLDIDFNIFKSSRTVANTADILVWNLDETTYQRLTLQNYLISLYTQYGEEDPVLFFRGYMDMNFSGRITSNNRLIDGVDNPIDIPTRIKLVDGLQAYRDRSINKNYREEVSTTQIIKDCIAAMGVGTAIFSGNIPAKKYLSFKAIGRPHAIIKKLCDALGINVNIQNGMIYVLTGNETGNEDMAVVLDESNSLLPRKQDSGLIEISSKFLPNLNPNDFVKCQFETVEGLFAVKDIRSNGNNYGRAGITKITIGI